MEFFWFIFYKLFIIYLNNEIKFKNKLVLLYKMDNTDKKTELESEPEKQEQVKKNV